MRLQYLALFFLGNLIVFRLDLLLKNTYVWIYINDMIGNSSENQIYE